jgi:hypothetical protein
MHQYFRLNGSDYYTIFDLPIQVTNEISASSARPSCDSLSNKLLPADQGNATGPRALLPYSVPKDGSSDKSAARRLKLDKLFLVLVWCVFGWVIGV